MPALAGPKAKAAAKNAVNTGPGSKAPGKRARRPDSPESVAIGALQPKLRVNDPDDAYEREADRIADRVMSMPEPNPRPGECSRPDREEGERKSPLQRQETDEEEQAQTFALQRRQDEEPEENRAQTSALQRREAPDQDPEESAQTASLQRERGDEEAEEPEASMQRQEMKEEEEQEQPTAAMQRQETGEETEEQEAQTLSRQRQEEKEEEPVQTSSLQRQEEGRDEDEQARASGLQRRTAEEEDEPVQQRARHPRRPRITPRFETDFRLLRRGGGQPLPDPLRAFLEPRFGRSFGDVRVHAGPDAAELARDANAHAFTVGKHIVFGAGEYRPGVEQGQRLIAHELTHVLQQRGGLHSVQREVLHEDGAGAAPKRSPEAAREELRELFEIGGSVVSPAVLRIVDELLRIALQGESGRALTELLDETEAASVTRIVEAGGYTLEFHLNPRGGAAAARWSLTRRDTEQTLFAHSRELPMAGEEAPGPANEERLIVATALPPAFEAANAAIVEPAAAPVEAAPAPDEAVAAPASAGPRAQQPPTAIESDALALADAAPAVESEPASAAGLGEKAGTDDPALARPAIDEDPDAEQVPQEPSAEEVAEEVKVQRKAVAAGAPPQPGAALSAELAAVTGAGGRAVPDSLRRFMEPRFGADLTGIRLHDDARASRLARSLGAKAFTRGEHIVFGAGQYRPESGAGRHLIAHEISHVLQQSGEARGRGGDLVQRLADDCPPADPVPEVEVVPSPASPAEDPAFQKAENRVENRAENQSQHGPGEEKSEGANAAAEVKEGEKQSHAQKDQVGKMDAEAANPPAFDKTAFIEKVLAEVEKIAPATLDDVFKFRQRNKAAEVKNAVTGEVDAAQDNSQGPLEDAAAEEPAPGESPRTPTALEVEPPGAQPGSVRADRAMPPPKTASEFDLRPDTVRTENILKEACITREFMDKHDDPELKAAAAAQDSLSEASEQLPAEYRDREASVLESARGDATSAGQSGVAAMFGERAGKFGDVGTGQQQTKTENELKREVAAREIDAVFTSTQSKVKTRLEQLDKDVANTFGREADAAVSKFTAFIDTNAEAHKKAWYETALEWLNEALFDEPPPEVQDFYAEGRATFVADLRVAIGNVADLVDTGLKDARKLVETGKTEVQQKLDALGSDLEDFKQQKSEEMNDKFRSLESEIRKKEGEIVQSLAKRYVQALEEAKAAEDAIREKYKNFLEHAEDAYHTLKDAVVGWIEKLAAIVGDAAHRIIKDPGQFLSNLGQGIIQGLTMFMSEIGENIKSAVVQWLTGNLGGAGIALPSSFDAKGIIGFLLELVGLGVANIKNIARKVLGAPVVALIEKGEAGAEKIKEIFGILASEGPAGLFRYLQSEFEQMKEQVLGEAGNAIAEGLVIAGIKKVLGIISGLVSGGVGTVVTIVATIIDVVLWFRDNAAQLAELVSTIAGTAMAILQGQVGVVANAINNLLKRLLPVVLGFVGALIGIGGVVGKIQKIFKAIRKPATKAITALFQKLKKTIKKLLGKVKKGKGKKKEKEKKLSSTQVVTRVMKELGRPARADKPEAALAEKQAQAQNLLTKYQPMLKTGNLRITITDRGAADVEEDAAVDFKVAASPEKEGKAPVNVVYKFVERKGRGFQLKEKYQGSFMIRTRMYGSGRGYGAAAIAERDKKVRALRRDVNHNPDPKGKLWEPEPGRFVSLKPPTDPTVEHSPTVVSHWNDTGRKTDQATRRAFFTFAGKEKSIKVLDRSRNSELGGRGKEYKPAVTASFTGPGGKR